MMKVSVKSESIRRYESYDRDLSDVPLMGVQPLK